MLGGKGLKAGLLAIAVASVALAAVAQEEGGGGRGGGGAGAGGGGRGSEGNRVFLGLGPKPDMAAALRGEPLFAANCARCHGSDARGDARTANLLYSSLVVTDVAGSNVGDIIRRGKGSMPGFPNLSDVQVHDIAMYLNQLIEDSANRGTYSYQNILVGNAGAGKTYFDRACGACHSAAGDMKRFVANKKPEEIQRGWLAPRGVPATVIVTQPGSAPVTGTLRQKSDFEVMLADSGGTVRVIPIEANTRIEISDKMVAHDALLENLTNTDMRNVTAYLASLK